MLPPGSVVGNNPALRSAVPVKNTFPRMTCFPRGAVMLLDVLPVPKAVYLSPAVAGSEKLKSVFKRERNNLTEEG